MDQAYICAIPRKGYIVAPMNDKAIKITQAPKTNTHTRKVKCNYYKYERPCEQ